MIEVERVFIPQQDIPQIIAKITALGFVKTEDARQKNYYIDFPDFRFESEDRDFRLRFSYHTDETFSGEIAFSQRHLVVDTEIRTQMEIQMENSSRLNRFWRLIVTAFDLIESYKLFKRRREFHREGSSIHIELDTSIQMTRYPHKHDELLEDTIQLCYEHKNSNNDAVKSRLQRAEVEEIRKRYLEIDALATKLGLTADALTLLNYRERFKNLKKL